jgi:hypothetical protein
MRKTEEGEENDWQRLVEDSCHGREGEWRGDDGTYDAVPRANGHAAEAQDARSIVESSSSTAISSAQTRRAAPLGGSSRSSDRTAVPGLTRAMELVPGPSRDRLGARDAQFPGKSRVVLVVDV